MGFQNITKLLKLDEQNSNYRCSKLISSSTVQMFDEFVVYRCHNNYVYKQNFTSSYQSLELNKETLAQTTIHVPKSHLLNSKVQP